MSVDSCMMELECSSINMNVELRPRSGGFKVGLCVQDLYLRDKMTDGSLCPSLIEPVKKVITAVFLHLILTYNVLSAVLTSKSLTICMR